MTGEFLTNRTKPFLLAGLGTSMLATAVMAFAPPYRSLGWLAGDTAEQ